MSRYIQILNALKQNIIRLSLTSGQAACRIHILERLEYPGIINVYGARGSGKTVLGWCLANEGHVVYVVDPVHLDNIDLKLATNSGPVIVFIDNTDYRRATYRHILDKLTHAQIRQAVIATQERVEDFVQTLPLNFVPSDAKIVTNNLSLLGFPSTISNDVPFESLWDILLYSARR